jgi:DNA-binding GntR family transcriptional regulator
MKPQMPASSRSDEAASQLRSEIFSGAAEPRSLLAESAVAQRLGVSRVPVREALFTLNVRGWYSSARPDAPL